MIADSGAQALPPARATVLPWLRGNSSRASTLPACSALGPPASAAQYSCRREPCTGRSAWLLLGRACLYAWIEHRSFGMAAARQGLPVRLDRAPLVRHGCCSAGLACTLGSSTARSAWLLLGRACLYAWIEHRSFGMAAARQGLPVRLDRAPLVRHGCCSAGLACTLGSSTARSAWLLLGRACLYAWIEHRSFGMAAARQGLPVRLD